MKRAEPEPSLEQQLSDVLGQPARKIGHHYVVAMPPSGSDAYARVDPDVWIDALQRVKRIPGDAFADVSCNFCSPAMLASTHGIDEMQLADAYGYGDDGLNYTLALYVTARAKQQ